MLYRELEPEKFWSISNKDANKKQKINNAILTNEYGASIKKDGEYIRAIYDTDGEIWIIGRGTDAKEVHNLDKHLVFITNWIKENFTKGTCILGELYVPGMTSRAIRAYTGSLVDKSLKNQKLRPPTFYIFDVWAVNGTDLMDKTYEYRMKILETFPKFGIDTPYIEFAKITTGTEEILNMIAEAFENGEEGVVLVKMDSTPNPGKRTAWKTLKIKKEFQNNIDCFFTGNWRPPTRDYSGSEIVEWPYWENLKTGEKILGKMWSDYNEGAPIEPVTKPYFLGLPGSLEVGVYKGQELTPICFLSGLTDELKQKFANDKNTVIMKPMAISGMETTDASIRHPKFIGFREDIPLSDCQYDKIFGEE